MTWARKGLGGIAAVVLLAGPAAATNGMNLEGYGPLASSMGGVSFAYDNGIAAVMNNPATLGLMESRHRINLALGVLGPSVSATLRSPVGLVTADSKANAFLMPSGGWVTRRGNVVFGIGMFAQGGMGTEYAADTWMSDPSSGQNQALQSGMVNRSEVSVGRVLFPIAVQVSERLSVGGTFDVVWAGMDLQMAMSEGQFVDMVTTKTIGEASGTLAQTFGQMYQPFGGYGVERLYHAYFDFNNGNAFTGAAKGNGYGGKVGAVFSANNNLSFGATYHAKTQLSDLEAGSAVMDMGVCIDAGMMMTGAPSGEYVDVDIPVTGQMTVRNFEWPATIGGGVTYQDKNWMVSADVRRVFWSNVMTDFRMTFTADNIAANGAFAGGELDATLFQNWGDQTVISVGGSYDISPMLQMRSGYNYSKNPIPATYVNALFPAIVESHLTFGMGYKLWRRARLDIAVSVSLASDQTNPGNGSTIPAVDSHHRQVNSQVMYSLEF